MEKLSNEILSLAGEYMVASELCKRGIYAQLTLGHHKATDILAETEHYMLKIQVKTKQSLEWPGVKGIYKDNHFLVLVDLAKREIDERSTFYVINAIDWKNFVAREKERHTGAEINDEGCITYPDGWKGVNIKPDQIEDCKEAWEKITNLIKGNR